METLYFLNTLFIIFRRFFMVDCYSLKGKMETMRARKRKLKTILIIEDEIEIRSFIARVLELEGYQVFGASDGAAGMEIIRDNSISLVILDLRLPGLDGWAILREIKRNPEFSKIPVVVLTAIAETMQRKRTLRMGATSYLIKPLSAHSLSRAVASVLHFICRRVLSRRFKSTRCHHLLQTSDFMCCILFDFRLFRPFPLTLYYSVTTRNGVLENTNYWRIEGKNSKEQDSNYKHYQSQRVKYPGQP